MNEIEKLVEMVADISRLRGMYDEACAERDRLREENKRLQTEFQEQMKAELKEQTRLIEDRDAWKSKALTAKAILERLASARQVEFDENHSEWGNFDDSYSHGDDVARSRIAEIARETLKLFDGGNECI